MVATASWYHCSVKPVSRSAGRSVVAAAAYRLGECLHDERYQTMHDYTRRRGVEATFTIAPPDAPQWAHDHQALWNAAEHAETRKNSTLAREVELALPSLLSPEERQRIAEQFAGELVDRYGVAVSVAIHAPGGKGDDRNYHAHILFTTREMTPEGLGKKTRVLDDKKTGPQEVKKLRELAADIINTVLKDANADIRVDHRSFKERGIDREPTTHLGPSATEIERRGETSDRGDINRQAEQTNREQQAAIAARDALTRAIEERREELSAPPRTPEDARERMASDMQTYKKTVRQHGAVRNTPFTRAWWNRAALRVAERSRNLAASLASKFKGLWRGRMRDNRDERGPDEGGHER